jgi:hypothetical protein
LRSGPGGRGCVRTEDGSSRKSFLTGERIE